MKIQNTFSDFRKKKKKKKTFRARDVVRKCEGGHFRNLQKSWVISLYIFMECDRVGDSL